jgi:uncharacterized membrane protein
MREPVLSVRKIVIAGVLSAIAILLGWTRLGFIPVPTLAGDATIMHVPAIIGGILEGPVVGGLVGFIFGVFSFLQATVPAFKDPLVSIFPRIFIGITAWLTYAGLKRFNEYLAIASAAVVGTLTNTVLVLGMAVLRGYIPLVAIPPIIPQALAELVIAVVITLAVVVAWKRIETGISRGQAKM